MPEKGLRNVPLKVIYKPLNAYASEFVPGQPVSTQESFFASVVGLLAAYQEDESKLYMPPVLPAVPLADIAVMSAWARSMEAIYKDPFGSAKLLQTLFPDAAHVPPAPEVSPYVPPTDVDTSTARLLTVTACLLNFFFQNHILQTTPIVLEIIEKKLEGRWTKSGPWRKTLLQRPGCFTEGARGFLHIPEGVLRSFDVVPWQVAFELDDLVALLRFRQTRTCKAGPPLGYSAARSWLNKVPKELLPRLTSAVHGLNLRWAAPGHWLFEDAPELRCMVPGRRGHADFAVLALSFQREEPTHALRIRHEVSGITTRNPR
ncbi:unnamed protein product [Symbiodinium natans]|uniref:Uncharacterized protein n=1 Tax=Symbiodinium natans TaxID=878477 RepID=A0A812LT19_9DINO|nr:unnamed protein product [Symbiodinium natans]